MGGWLVKRSLDALLTTVIATVVLIALVRVLPGDPLAAVIADHPTTPETRAALEATWGVHRTIPQTVLAFFGGLVRGDLGISPSQQLPVTTVLAERLGPTLLLGFLTLLIDFTLGLALGAWSALRPGSRSARAIGALSLIGYALPSFVIGMVGVWLFAVTLRWLPAGGMSDPLRPLDATRAASLVDQLRHLLLPLATMVLATIAVPLRQQRSAMLGVVARPWVLAARARGVSPWRVAWRHCWRPALTPIVTLLGLWLPMLVAGAVFVEYVFAWPGVGSLIAEATATRDTPLVMAAGALLIAMVQAGALLADFLYRVVDPAQRHAA